MKKAISILMSIVLLLGIMPMNALADGNGDTSSNPATVYNIYATFPEEGDPTNFEVANSEPDSKLLFAKFISGGSHDASTEEGLPLYLDNATVTGYTGTHEDIRLSGTSYLYMDKYIISSTVEQFPAYNNEKVTTDTIGALFDFYNSDTYNGSNAKPYSYTFTESTTQTGLVNMDTLTVNNDVTLNIAQGQGENNEVYSGAIVAEHAVIKGSVVIEGNNIQDSNRLVVDVNGSLTVENGGSLSGSGNACLEICTGATVTGITLYDYYDETSKQWISFTCDRNKDREEFSYDTEAKKWVRNQSGGNPGVENGKFKVFYDDVARDGESQAGNVTVKSTNADSIILKNYDSQTFEKNKQIDFTLTPPTHRANVTPIVEIVVRSEHEEVFSSENTNDRKIVVTPNGNGTFSFSFVPTTDSGFEVYVWWSEFDRFGSDGNTFVVQVNVRGDGNITFTPASSSSSQPEPGNVGNKKYRFNKSVLENNGTLNLTFNPDSRNFLDSVRIENAQYTTSSDPAGGWTQIKNGENNFSIDSEGKYSYILTAVPENSNIFIEAEFRSGDDHGGGDPQEPNPGQSDPTDYEGAKAAIESDRFAYYAAGINQKETIKGYLATELWYEYFDPGRPYAGMFDTHKETGEVVKGKIDTLKNSITLSEATSTDGSEIARGNDSLPYYTYTVLLHNEITEGETGSNLVSATGKVYILNNPLDIVIATTYNDITSYQVETVTDSMNDVKVYANFDRDDRGDAMIDVFGNGVSAVGSIGGGSKKVWGAHVTQEHSNLGDDPTIGGLGFRCFVAHEGFMGTKVYGDRDAAAWNFTNANVYEVSSQESSWAEVFYGNNKVTVEATGFDGKVIESIELDIAKIPVSAATIRNNQNGTFTIQLNSGYDSIPIKVMYEGDTVTYYQTIHRIGLALGDEHSQGDSNNYVIWHGTDHSVKYDMPENANHVVYASFYYRADKPNEVKPVNLYATIRYNDGTVERKNITSAITDSGTVVENGDINRESGNQEKVAGQGTDKYYDDFVVWSGSETDYQTIQSVDIFAYEKSDDPSIFGGAKIGSGDGYTWEPDNRQ